MRYDDGSVVVWRPPAGGDLVGAYWDYRWRKWLENVTEDPEREALWRPAAMFAARQVRRAGPHAGQRDPRPELAGAARHPGRRAPTAALGESEALYTLSLR